MLPWLKTLLVKSAIVAAPLLAVTETAPAQLRPRPRQWSFSKVLRSPN